MYVVKYIKEKEKTKANKQKNKTNLVQKPIHTHEHNTCYETYKKIKIIIKATTTKRT